MLALYLLLLIVPVSLMVLTLRDRLLNKCIDRLFIFNERIDANLVQIAKFEAMGLGIHSQFYRDQIENLDRRIKWEARLYKVLV